MPIADPGAQASALNLDLIATSKRMTERFEDAYQWMLKRHSRLEPCETVGTIAFASKGECKINHVTWAELVDLHLAYQQLDKIEKRLSVQSDRADAS